MNRKEEAKKDRPLTAERKVDEKCNNKCSKGKTDRVTLRACTDLIAVSGATVTSVFCDSL